MEEELSFLPHLYYEKWNYSSYTLIFPNYLFSKLIFCSCRILLSYAPQCIEVLLCKITKELLLLQIDHFSTTPSLTLITTMYVTYFMEDGINYTFLTLIIFQFLTIEMDIYFVVVEKY